MPVKQAEMSSRRRVVRESVVVDTGGGDVVVFLDRGV